jgi:hypothetical protein
MQPSVSEKQTLSGCYFVLQPLLPALTSPGVFARAGALLPAVVLFSTSVSYATRPPRAQIVVFSFTGDFLYDTDTPSNG